MNRDDEDRLQESEQVTHGVDYSESLLTAEVTLMPPARAE